DRRASEAETRRRLLLAAGARGAFVPLTDTLVETLYERFPDLLRGPFKQGLSAYNVLGAKLAERALAAGDDVLVDQIARLVLPLRPAPKASGPFAQLEPLIERLAAWYEKKPDPAARAAAVLGLLPARSFYGFEDVVERNRLTRLFFVDLARDYLAGGRAVRDL